MTPEAWFAATDPHPLLAFVWPRPLYWWTEGGLQELPPVTIRRLRLFGCACARMVWDILPTDARSAVQIRERFADGKATEFDLRASRPRMADGAFTFQQHALNATSVDPADAARSAAKALATRAAGPAPPGRPTTPEWHATWTAAFAAARAIQADYARDIFPPPDYTRRLDPAWLTSTVLALARHADESGDFSVVPILADALQDAGCDDETALRCCRAPGNVHVRGNWVVDLVLGRS
jgi:hypothetical protein